MRHRRGKLRRRYGRAAAKLIRRGVTGDRLWQIPGGRLQIYWAGPGARLKIGFDLTRAGGSMSVIDHPSADGNYRTAKEAAAAVKRFMESK